MVFTFRRRKKWLLDFFPLKHENQYINGGFLKWWYPQSSSI